MTKDKNGEGQASPVTLALGRQESQAEPRSCLYLAMDVTELGQCLPSTRRSGFQPQPCTELGLVAQACHPSSWEVETGGSGVQSHSPLHKNSEATLNYMRLS